MKFFSFQTRKPKRADRRSPFETDYETDGDLAASNDADAADIDNRRARRREAPEEQLSSLSGAERRSSADRAAQRAADEPEYEPEPKPEPDEAAKTDPFDAIADLSGGADRHEAVIGFGEKNFRSEPTKSELSAAAARVRDADRSLKAHLAAAQPAPKPAQRAITDAALRGPAARGPAAGSPATRNSAASLQGKTGPRRAPHLPSETTVFRPAAHLLDDVAFLGKEAEQTLGPAVPKAVRRSPLASAHLPYATRDDHAADVIEANAVARKGGDAAPLHRPAHRHNRRMAPRRGGAAAWSADRASAQTGVVTRSAPPELVP